MLLQKYFIKKKKKKLKYQTIKKSNAKKVFKSIN